MPVPNRLPGRAGALAAAALAALAGLACAQSVDVSDFVLPVDPANRGAEIAEIHPAFDLDPRAGDFGRQRIPALWRSNGLVTGLMGIHRFGPAVPAFLCWKLGGRRACPPLAPIEGGAKMTRMQSDAITVAYAPFAGVEVEQTHLAVNSRLFRSRARLVTGSTAPVAAELFGGVLPQTETGHFQVDDLARLTEKTAAEAEHAGIHYFWRLWENRGRRSREIEFALAFGPDAASARRAADGARDVPFDEAVSVRRERSEAFYASVPRIRFADPQLDLFHRIQWERLRALAENAAGGIPHAYFMGTSAPWGIDGLWLWDAAFQSQLLHYADPAWAGKLIEAVLAQQDESGLVPHWSTPGSRTEISQPPILSWAVWRLYTFHGDRPFLERVYPSLARLHRWFAARRTRDDGLPFWKQPDESGMDNSPAFDESPDAHVDLCAQLLADAGMLAKIAQALGRPAESREWTAQEARWRERLARMWGEGPEGPFFFPMKGPRHVPVYAIQGFLPLWDAALEPERRRALLQRLQDPGQFWPPYPVPSVSLRAPQFMQPKWFANTYGSPESGRRAKEKLQDYSSVYWRGPVWVFSNAIIYEGLRSSGEFAVANALGERMVRMMLEAARYGGMLWENFDPRDGRPSRLLPKGQADEMAASIYFLKVLYDAHLGLEPVEPPTPARLRLRYTALPQAEASGLRYGPWTLAQAREDGGARLEVGERPRPDSTLEIENRAGRPLRLSLGGRTVDIAPGATAAF